MEDTISAFKVTISATNDTLPRDSSVVFLDQTQCQESTEKGSCWGWCLMKRRVGCDIVRSRGKRSVCVGQQLEQQVLVRSESLSLCVYVGAGVGEKSIPRLPLPPGSRVPWAGPLGLDWVGSGTGPGQTSPAAFP